MKLLITTLLLIGSLAIANDAQPDAGNKLTTKDAKKLCKDEGKTGEELIKCMKEKKGEK